ncbi:hypothetical protein ABWH92_12175 [Ahrensia marina]|uniref:hypothetical protein n=1 Tax=Ahrensia marina TaxID=1514904 RepID=UPI0035D063B5
MTQPPKEREDGGPAFPLIVPLKFKGGVLVENNVFTGLSLRDWFAGQALAGIASISNEGFSLSEVDCAAWAYQYADAMIAARSTVKEGE